MAVKVLGQVNPAATTATDLYTVPAGKSTVCSTLTVCNTGAVDATYRVYVRVAGAAAAAKQYLVYDATLSALSTDLFTIGVALAATDVVTVYASNTSVAFNLFGDES